MADAFTVQNMDLYYGSFHALIIDVFAHQPDVARDFAALHQIVHPVQTL